MNDDKDNYSVDDFDIDQILAEVRAMKAAKPVGPQVDESPAPQPDSAGDETGEPADDAGDSLAGDEPDDFFEDSLTGVQSTMPPAAQEDPDEEEPAPADFRPVLVLFEPEEPEPAIEPVIEPAAAFSGSPDLPWWESPEAEEIFGPRKTVDPPDEIVIEPVEIPDTQPEPVVPVDFFSAAPAEPGLSAPVPVVLSVSSGMETDEARERFLSDLVLEKTAEHDVPGPNDPIEKPGVIVEKGVSAKTSDLDPMPTVLPAEEVLRAAQIAEEKTRISGAAAPGSPVPDSKKDVLDGQIILRGFETREPEAETVSELSEEEALIARRREKAKKFIKIVGIPEQEDENTPSDLLKGYEELDREQEEPGEEKTSKPEVKTVLEYRFPEQRNRIYNAVGSAVKRATAGTAFLAVIELLSLGLLFLPKLLESAAVDMPLPGAGGNAIVFANLILLSLAAFFGMGGLLSGFKSLFRLRPNCDAGVSLAVTVCAVHLVLALFLPAPEGYTVSAFTAAAVFTLLLGSSAKKTSHACTLDNFRFCAFDRPQELYSISAVDDANEAFELGRGILMGNPAVVYSSKINFPSDFLANAKDAGLAERFCRILVPTAAAAAVVAGFIAGLIEKNLLFGFSVFTSAMCLAVPAGSLLAAAVPLRLVNKHLNAGGAMIVSQDAAEELSASNAVVVDSADIFDRARCDMHGMKDFKNFRLDDILLYAAAMVIRSGGPLTDVFDKVIAGHRELLPPVRSYSYEDRQGISALIHNHMVLMGNRTFMVNHSIDIPNKSDEDKYKHDGRKILYLAIANKIAAIFVVSYKADETLLPYLKMLENNGVQLLVRTCDANITEDLLSDCFGLPITHVKVVSATAGRLFNRMRGQEKETAPARVLHDGSALSLVKSIAAAYGVNFGIKAGQIVQAVGVGLGLIGLIALTALSAAQSAGALQIVLFQAFWAAAALAAGFIKKAD